MGVVNRKADGWSRKGEKCKLNFMGVLKHRAERDLRQILTFLSMWCIDTGGTEGGRRC